MKTRPLTEIERKVFTYLNDLRESGETNMFGARPYIEQRFPSQAGGEAKRILLLWMDNFKPDGDYETVTED